MENTPKVPEAAVTRLLAGWEAERRQGIDDAITFTRINGMLCNEPESWGFFIFRHLEYLYKLLPASLQSSNHRTLKEAKGFKGAGSGFFLSGYNGGGKMAQVFVESGRGQVIRSDELLRSTGSLLTLVTIGPDAEARCGEASKTLERLCLPPGLLSQKAIVALAQDAEVGATAAGINGELLLKFRLRNGRQQDVIGDVSNYNVRPYIDRLGPSTRYAIVRPDFYIFALLNTGLELEGCLRELVAMIK